MKSLHYKTDKYLMLVLPYHSNSGSDDEGGVDSHGKTLDSM